MTFILVVDIYVSLCPPHFGVSDMFVLVSQYQIMFTFSIIENILIYYFTIIILSVQNSLLCYTHCTCQVFLCFPSSRKKGLFFEALASTNVEKFSLVYRAFPNLTAAFFLEKILNQSNSFQT